jgi:branched-chain amino acid aminotransferase
MKKITVFIAISALLVATVGLFYTVRIQRVAPESPTTQPSFGSTFTDHLFIMDWDQNNGWHNQRITPYQSFSTDPASLHMHYGQEIFEGMKAFTTHDNRIALFRPRDHLQRLNKSAHTMVMPEIDIEDTLTWLKKLIQQDSTWVPTIKGQSLYIRPTMIATEASINLKPSSSYKFFVILSPVGSFYQKGFNPISIMVTDTYTRSSIGGVGTAKTAGNYAASMRAQIDAQKNGYAQVLWLDPVERKFVEEVGTMNVFFIIDDVLVTPMLTNTILPGITRKTVLELGKKWNMAVSERKISIQEVIHAIEKGTLTEAFGTGTAVGITPIGKLAYRNHEYSINDNKTGPVTQKIYNALTTIQQGEACDESSLLEYIT